MESEVTTKRMKVLVSSSEEEDDEKREWKKKKKIYIKQLEGDVKKKGDDYKKARILVSNILKKVETIKQEKKITDEENEEKIRKQQKKLDKLKEAVDKKEDTIKAAKDENDKLLQKYKMAMKKCNDFETENTMLKSMHVSIGEAGRAYAPPDFGLVLTAPPQIFYPNPYCLPPQIFRPWDMPD